MIALTQRRAWAPAQEYLARRIREGKSRKEAVRALKRYLVRAIWRAWKKCVAPPLAEESPGHFVTTPCALWGSGLHPNFRQYNVQFYDHELPARYRGALQGIR